MGLSKINEEAKYELLMSASSALTSILDCLCRFRFVALIDLPLAHALEQLLALFDLLIADRTPQVLSIVFKLILHK